MPKRKPLSPELNFIVSCSRTKLGEKIESSLKGILTKPLNWEQIFSTARYHGVASLLYHNISANEFIKSKIPKSVIAKFKTYYYSVLARNLALKREFYAIYDGFKEQNIELIPLKGIILGDCVYGNPALRPIHADIDILVRENDFAIASSQLEKMGYNETCSAEKHIRTFHKKGVFIELHRLLLPPWLNRFNIDLLWMRSKEHIIDNKKIRILSPEDMLLSLPLQIRHDWPQFQLFRLCDLHEILINQEDELDWDYILKSSKEYGIQGAIYWGLYLCQQLLCSPCPDNIWKSFPSGLIRRQLLKKLLERELDLLLDNGLPNKDGRRRNGLLKTFANDSLIDSLKIFTHKLYPFYPPSARIPLKRQT
ncbi:MAG: nucleotidyltransferase family protein [Candidatus Omnitrophota bacterium]